MNIYILPPITLLEKGLFFIIHTRLCTYEWYPHFNYKHCPINLFIDSIKKCPPVILGYSHTFN